MAYILKEKEFFGRNFYVKRGVLIPRSDSEVIIEKTIEFIKKEKFLDSKTNFKILDLCCGSGILGITLHQEIKNQSKNAHLVSLDLSKVAVEVANKNCNLLNVDSFEVINEDVFNSKILDNLIDFDLIVYNPPYILNKNIEKLMIEVKNFEPHLALDGGEDGFIFYQLFFDKLSKQIDKISKKMIISIEIDEPHLDLLKINFNKLEEAFTCKFFDDLSNQKRLMLICN